MTCIQNIPEDQDLTPGQVRRCLGKKQLHVERLYKVVLGIPVGKVSAFRPQWANRTYGFVVQAMNRAEAHRTAQEMAWGVAWHRGVAPESGKMPEQWALEATSASGQIRLP